MKILSTLAAAGIASLASAEIVTVEFDMAGFQTPGGAVGMAIEALSHYENATILNLYWSDMDVSLVGGVDESGQETPGFLSLIWFIDLPEVAGRGWYTFGVDATGPTGDYTIAAGSFDLAPYSTDIGPATDYSGYNYGAGMTGTAGSTILSGTMGFTVDLVPAPGALAFIGLAGLGRRRRA